MKTITVSDEMAEFIKNLAHTIETQDTRCTAKPICFTVEMTVDEVCADGCGDRYLYVNDDGDEYTEESVKERFEEDNDDPEIDFDDYLEDKYRKIEVRDGHKYKGFFLTKDGYDQHVRMDGHNISRLCNEKGYRSYVDHVYRNPEMEQVINFILEAGKQL